MNQISNGMIDQKPANYWALLLDFIPPLLRAWKLIVCCVIATGLLAGVATQFLPRTYTSTAYVGPIEESVARAAEAILRSTPVLTAVLDKFPNMSSGALPSVRRGGLDSRIRFAPTRGADAKRSAIYVLEVGDADPAQAKAILDALIDAWLARTKPPADVASRLEVELSATQVQITSVTAVIADLLKASALPPSDPKSAALIPNIADVIKLRTESLLRAADITAKLNGQSRDILFAEPDLPDTAKRTARRLVVLSAMAVAFALVILWIVIRHAFIRAAGSPIYGPRFNRIGDAMPRWRARKSLD